MNDRLIDELSHLKLRENNVKRCLEYKYYDENKRTELFHELKEIKDDIARVKFKISLERKIKNEKSRESV